MDSTYVRSDKTERWHHDCVGVQKKQGLTVMCWGMIGYGWKGPFHMWETETEDERKKAMIEIVHINGEMVDEAERANAEWRASPEWLALREQELEAARLLPAAEKAGAPKKKTPQSWWGKKYRDRKSTRLNSSHRP